MIRPELGAGLASYDLLGRTAAVPLFRAAPPGASQPFDLACNLLLPWSGRISGGGFSFAGKFHKLAPNLKGEALPIHGNAFAAAWKVASAETASARLVLHSDGPGPFRYDATAEYALDSGALSVSLSLTSRASMALPYGMGLHPWFPRTRLATLRAAASTVWDEDAQHLPAAKAAVKARKEMDFGAARPLPRGWLHAWFTGWDGAATITWPERRLALDVAATPPLTGCVLYSPGEESGFFCFEPVSHPVDAHNLTGGAEANGLAVLRPGESFAASARFAPRRV